MLPHREQGVGTRDAEYRRGVADDLVRTAVTITAASFPTPHVVKTINNPAQWDQIGGFAELQADEANEALALLDSQLATASTAEERIAAFENAYRHVADWRYQLAAEGVWTRTPDPEEVRTPIGDQSATYPLFPEVGGREEGSPSYRMVSEMQQVALSRFSGSEKRLQNRVELPDGQVIDGNVLVRSDAIPGTTHPPVVAVTASEADREMLRRAAFELLAGLEARRAETGRLDPEDPVDRQAFADAAYFLFQGPEFRRGTDASLRTFLVAAYARIFQQAAVLPQGIDLDAMVRGQHGFHEVMRDDLRPIRPADPASAAPVHLAERTRGGVRRGPAGAER